MNERRQLKIQTFLNIAEELSNLSTCKRLSVGAVITDESFRVIGMGYNGRVKGGMHCDRKQDSEPGRCDCIHRQQNRMMFAGHDFHLPNKKAFITTSPCLSCRKMLNQFGVKEVYFLKQYRDMAPVKYLLLNGIDAQAWE